MKTFQQDAVSNKTKQNKKRHNLCKKPEYAFQLTKIQRTIYKACSQITSGKNLSGDFQQFCWKEQFQKFREKPLEKNLFAENILLSPNHEQIHA